MYQTYMGVSFFGHRPHLYLYFVFVFIGIYNAHIHNCSMRDTEYKQDSRKNKKYRVKLNIDRTRVCRLRQRRLIWIRVRSWVALICTITFDK
jgi:hypothetical protein